MSKIYFTLTGTKYYHSNEFLKPGMKLKITTSFDERPMSDRSLGRFRERCRIYEEAVIKNKTFRTKITRFQEDFLLL